MGRQAVMAGAGVQGFSEMPCKPCLSAVRSCARTATIRIESLLRRTTRGLSPLPHLLAQARPSKRAQQPIAAAHQDSMSAAAREAVDRLHNAAQKAAQAASPQLVRSTLCLLLPDEVICATE
jgi:hypothetical protein